MSDFWDRFLPPQDEFATEDYGGDAFMELAADADILDDGYALDALYAGWFDLETDADTRSEARQNFLDYMDWDSGEFDWDSWREWYGEAA